MGRVVGTSSPLAGNSDQHSRSRTVFGDCSEGIWLQRKPLAAVRPGLCTGFHYVSDYDAGNLLGEKMYIFMNKADYKKENE